jgi:hypothetical protein
VNPEGGEFAVDAPIAPGAVLAGRSQHERLDAAAGGRPARVVPAGEGRMAPADQVTTPTRDRVRDTIRCNRRGLTTVNTPDTAR